MARRWPLLGLLLVAAFLGGVAALGTQQGVAMLRPLPTPSSTATATAFPTPQVLIIERATTVPTQAPTPLPADAQAQQVSRLQQQVSQQMGLLLVLRAEQHVALAADSLRVNDLPRANQELVAAHAALDRAYEHVSEDLKQVVDHLRRDVGRIRADLVIAPEGLNDEMRSMQDQLLALATP